MHTLYYVIPVFFQPNIKQDNLPLITHSQTAVQRVIDEVNRVRGSEFETIYSQGMSLVIDR